MHSVSSTQVLDLPCTRCSDAPSHLSLSGTPHSTTTSLATSKAASYVEGFARERERFMRGLPHHTCMSCKPQAQSVLQTQWLSKGLVTTLDQECPTAGHDQTNSEGQRSLYMRLARWNCMEDTLHLPAFVCYIVSHWVGRNMHSTSERKLKAHMATAGHTSHTLLWSS